MQESTVDGTAAQPDGGFDRGGSAQAAAGARPYAGGDVPSAGQPQGPEAELWVGRVSWKYFLGRMTSWLLVVIALSILAWFLASKKQWITGRTGLLIVGAVAGLSGILVFGGIALRVLGTHYRLTSQRLFITRGILSHAIDQTELVRVDDVRLFKSLFGRVFNVGNVTVITTDASDRNILIEGVHDPTVVAEAIRSRMRSLRGKSVYVETL